MSKTGNDINVPLKSSILIGISRMIRPKRIALTIIPTVTFSLLYLLQQNQVKSIKHKASVAAAKENRMPAVQQTARKSSSDNPAISPNLIITFFFIKTNIVCGCKIKYLARNKTNLVVDKKWIYSLTKPKELKASNLSLLIFLVYQ